MRKLEQACGRLMPQNASKQCEYKVFASSGFPGLAGLGRPRSLFCQLGIPRWKSWVARKYVFVGEVFVDEVFVYEVVCL